MKLRIRLMLENDRGEPFMGIGLLRLLQAVEREHSLLRAARSLGMSYVKALHIVDRLEKNLQERVLLRRRGGFERGGAELTSYGRALVAAFNRLHDNVNASARTAFRVFRKKLRHKEKTP